MGRNADLAADPLFSKGTSGWGFFFPLQLPRVQREHL